MSENFWFSQSVCRLSHSCKTPCHLSWPSEAGQKDGFLSQQCLSGFYFRSQQRESWGSHPGTPVFSKLLAIQEGPKCPKFCSNSLFRTQTTFFHISLDLSAESQLGIPATQHSPELTFAGVWSPISFATLNHWFSNCGERGKGTSLYIYLRPGKMKVARDS